MRRITLTTLFLSVFLLCSSAHATHIQYVDIADLSGDNLPTGGSWSYTFDLLSDNMYLWFIGTSNYSFGGTTPDVTTADTTGSYDENDALHYVTLRIDPTNYERISASTLLKLTVNDIDFVITDWSNPISLYDWGVPGGTIDDPYGIVANDYKITVKLTALSDLGVDFISNVNLEGCFETVTDAVPGSGVPEPATMFLFGFGLLGLAGTVRKKITITDN